jgi:hypothetical protein
VRADPDRCIERPASIERAAPCPRARRTHAGVGLGARDLMGFCCWARPGACRLCRAVAVLVVERNCNSGWRMSSELSGWIGRHGELGYSLCCRRESTNDAGPAAN